LSRVIAEVIMLVLMGMLTLLVGAPPEEKAAGETDKLEGHWRMVSIEFDGAQMPAQQVNDYSLSFKAGKFTSHLAGERKTGTYKTDPTKKPKSIDIVADDGPSKGKNWSLIYSLEGNTLRICGAEVGKDRPTAFEAKKESGNILMVLRRD
jgi:uncharacterized protein (TIGR03067 family)